jgi:hypothetical protein
MNIEAKPFRPRGDGDWTALAASVHQLGRGLKDGRVMSQANLEQLHTAALAIRSLHEGVCDDAACTRKAAPPAPWIPPSVEAKRREIGDLISDAIFELELRDNGRLVRLRADGFVRETAKYELAEVAQKLSRLVKGEPLTLAHLRGIAVTYMDDDDLQDFARRRGHVQRIAGAAFANHAEIVLNRDLNGRTERHAFAHELAHSIFRSLCDGSPEGEYLAAAFADAWMEVGP